MNERLRLHAETMGTGRIGLLLIHPNPADSTYWLYQTAHMSTWFTTISVDLPGYGHSPRLREAVTMPDLASAVWNVAEGLGLEGVVVAGVSIGAALGIHIAGQQPERCAALILSGYGYNAVKAFAAKRIAGYRADGLAYRAQHLRDGYSPQFYLTDAGRLILQLADARAELCDVESIIRLFEAHGEPDPPSLFALSQPTLIISGSADYAHAGAAALQSRIPSAELVTLHAAGHACNQEQPWEWDRIALDFVQRRTGLIK